MLDGRIFVQILQLHKFLYNIHFSSIDRSEFEQNKIFKYGRIHNSSQTVLFDSTKIVFKTS